MINYCGIMSEERPPQRQENSNDSNSMDVHVDEIYRDEVIPSAHASTADRYYEDEDDEYSVGDDDNAFDDEATIEHEEKLQNSSEIASELEALQKEQDMPIEDLMKLYGCGCHSLEIQSSSGGGKFKNSSYYVDEPNSSSSYENNSFRSDYVRTVTTTSSNVDENDAEDDGEKIPPDIRFLASENSITEDDDEDYTPEDEWRKEIRIGESYQADLNDVVVESLSQTSEIAAGETIIFDPSRLTPKDIEDYLQKFQLLVGEAQPSNFVTSDNEIALEILRQNDYNVVDALSCISNYDYRSEKSKRNALFGWTDDDRRNFENCLHSHGKDFNFVNRCLAGKTMRQIVYYYYHWKISPYYAHFVDSLEKDYNNFLFTIQQM
uniref:Uncharacterized protein n=1 Tax=Romanomermis culicivorax TaxID=13658 RepID=A0A915HWZ5_ROMCU